MFDVDSIDTEKSLHTESISLVVPLETVSLDTKIEELNDIVVVAKVGLMTRLEIETILNKEFDRHLVVVGSIVYVMPNSGDYDHILNDKLNYSKSSDLH